MGPLGVRLEVDERGMCIVSSTLSASAGGVEETQLQVGDTIVSCNDMSLSEMDGGVDAWIPFFNWLGSGKREVKVLRNYQAVAVTESVGKKESVRKGKKESEGKKKTVKKKGTSNATHTYRSGVPLSGKRSSLLVCVSFI